MVAGAFLIVEDDPAANRTLERIFGRYRPVRIAVTAVEAFAAFGEGDYAGVIIDIGLPDFSGLEVLTFIRERSPLIPIMVLTARFDRDVANRAQALRAECVFKPATIDNYLAFIYRVLATAPPDERVAKSIEAAAQKFGLSPRETQILSLAVAELPRDAMAFELGISDNTLKTYIGLVLRKCNEATLAELVQTILKTALGTAYAPPRS